jgi:23S rRNA (pseudouridine1915-N3)-methyltransferase
VQAAKGTLIALSPDGESMDSHAFAAVIKNGIRLGDITFAIGGSYGLGLTLRQKADHIISFSDMTFPHQLFRVILLEQIYRAFMISEGRTYHK